MQPRRLWFSPHPPATPAVKSQQPCPTVRQALRKLAPAVRHARQHLQSPGRLERGSHQQRLRQAVRLGGEGPHSRAALWDPHPALPTACEHPHPPLLAEQVAPQVHLCPPKAVWPVNPQEDRWDGARECCTVRVSAPRIQGTEHRRQTKQIARVPINDSSWHCGYGFQQQQPWRSKQKKQSIRRERARRGEI